MQKHWKRFLIIFIVSFVIIFAFSFPKEYLDEYYWGQGAELLVSGKQIMPSHMTFGYPGTTVLFPTAVLIYTKVNTLLAFNIVMALLISITATLSSILAYALKPQSKWWIAIAGFLTFNPLYFLGTPPSIIVSNLFVLLVLTLFLIQEKKESASNKHFVYLGIISGLSLATRFDISVLTFISVVIFLLTKHSIKRTSIFKLSALITFYILTPFIWVHPLQYFIDVIRKIGTHIKNPTIFQPTYQMALIQLLFAITAFVWVLFVLFRKKNTEGISKAVLGWLCVTSVILLAVLFNLSFHPFWYFFPIIIIWECLLPLFVLTEVEKVNTIPPFLKTKERFILDVVLLLVFAQAVVLLF